MEKIRWSSPSREVVQGVKFVDGIREEEDASLGSCTKFDSNFEPCSTIFSSYLGYLSYFNVSSSCGGKASFLF